MAHDQSYNSTHTRKPSLKRPNLLQGLLPEPSPQELSMKITERIEYHLSGTAPKSTGLYDTICMLLRDPNLATQVRHLHLDLRANCHDPHDYYTHDALSYYMDNMGYNSDWKEEVVKGSETALAGLLLTLLPELEHLEVRLFKQYKNRDTPQISSEEEARDDSAIEISDSSLDVTSDIVYESIHFSTYELFREPPAVFDMTHIAAFRSLTSICSPTLLPWNIMCFPNLKQVTVSLEIDSCGRFEFDLPNCAQIPQEEAAISGIISLIAKVPIEFLNTANSEDKIFAYVPTVLRHAPGLKRLALHLKRDLDDGPCPRNDIKRSYQTLIRSLSSKSVEELIIDTCDIEASAVRKCPVDFFESLHPINSLSGFPCLRRIVAPQEAFIRVESSLWKRKNTGFGAPTCLLPDTIETVEIIDSTTTLNMWAIRILDASMAATGLKVSTLSHLSKVVLWCDRWYPTIVPDYRTDKWSQ
ncbi:uncharacterized protein K460DRAFT_403979 [Cucurbitaria berberidis CBS 394.84]|uniref:Uncharacterized protein n=1 Tax=Cucurbitaria berberidis CBS 394.84 TaxID=1168544 RepID=A0A9P4LBM1_9PLEO|nr:uncharacterized protein K460DRAFT_403979 [Cucurbitaria berberidis CBS 394.84]KAF1848708.1 hypothetical protein K460DRAFT_403979 [Cucurbitaria berberidis CBS 394.84]